ncbi:MAG: hypothetical protein Q8N31_22190 [Reyranella sp.]|nr:hypothetical protein [Reyranella sp.]MDP3162729.1 hypothetical protein [Reyranella sp.]
MSIFPRETADLLILVIVTVVVAVTITVFRRRASRPPPAQHDALMKRAEALAEKSPFLKNACREYRANNHLSKRQAGQVAKAVARLEGNAASRK